MHDGPWKVIDKDDAGSGLPVRGEIVRHRSGAVVLRCPACNSIQFAHSPITGPDDAPTLLKPIQCGAGNCKRCGVWFSVDAGKTVITEAPETPVRPIPAKLRRGGVKEAPKLPPEFR